MNLGELKAEIGRLLNDPNNERWSASVLATRLTEAQNTVVSYTHALKSTDTYTPTAGSALITVDSDFMNITRVTLTLPSGRVKVVEGITREELDYRYPDWMNMSSGEPAVYWFDATAAYINLVPAPDAAHSIADALKVWNVRRVQPMSSDTDKPFDNNSAMIPYHMAVIHWTVSQCWMDDATPEALAKSRFHKSGMLERPGEFEKVILRIRADFDAPIDVPAHILWRPQGGRISKRGFVSKSNPFGW